MVSDCNASRFLGLVSAEIGICRYTNKYWSRNETSFGKKRGNALSHKFPVIPEMAVFGREVAVDNFATSQINPLKGKEKSRSRGRSR